MEEPLNNEIIRKSRNFVIHSEEDTTIPFELDIPAEDTDNFQRDTLSIIKELTNTNSKLSEDIRDLTRKYQESIEEFTREIRTLTKEIRQLKHKIDRINKVRSLTIDIPESWIIED